MSTVRCVVLHHTGCGDPHFDLMIESAPGSVLNTWRLIDWPPVAGDRATRIGDHRREYLLHEGAVSNNRGLVRRIAAGQCEVACGNRSTTITFQDANATLLILQHIAESEWRVIEVSP